MWKISNLGLLLDVSLMLPHSLLEGIGCETCVGLHSVVHFIYYCCTIDNIADGAVGELGRGHWCFWAALQLQVGTMASFAHFNRFPGWTNAEVMSRLRPLINPQGKPIIGFWPVVSVSLILWPGPDLPASWLTRWAWYSGLVRTCLALATTQDLHLIILYNYTGVLMDLYFCPIGSFVPPASINLQPPFTFFSIFLFFLNFYYINFFSFNF